jgi:hypothetical protein
MDGHLRLSAREGKTCLKTLRTARTARRALVLLLLADGRSYREIRTATFASPTLIRSVKREFARRRAQCCGLNPRTPGPHRDQHATGIAYANRCWKSRGEVSLRGIA